MKRVLTAVVLVPFVLLLVFRAPLWLFALAVAGIIRAGACTSTWRFQMPQDSNLSAG